MLTQRHYALFFVLFCCAAFAWAGDTARNVILFIGDGMGPAQVTGGRLFKGGVTEKLAMEQLPVVGLSRTYSSNGFVTDSAAAATALATGVKTYNGSLGMTDPQYDTEGKSHRLQNLCDVARAQGKATGVMTTTRVTHATPAGFYARVPQRDMEEKIADQVAKSNLTLLMGGGAKFFHSGQWHDPVSGQNGKRKSGETADELASQGWTVVRNAGELAALDATKADLRVLGLFNYDHMLYDLQRTTGTAGEPPLEDMVSFAVKRLSQNPKGFFLMVEGGRIDHACHENNARLAFGDVVSFDRAIARARKEAPADTLIVVTADHETGGLNLNGYAPREKVKGNALLGSFGASTANRAIIGWGSGPGGNSSNDVPTTPTQHVAAYPSEAAAHTGVDVEIFAGGPGQALLQGVMDNSEIPWRIARAMGTAFSDPINKANHTAHLNPPRNVRTAEVAGD
jgi:alkaline phosphatase